jgi:hypothetical protein
LHRRLENQWWLFFPSGGCLETRLLCSRIHFLNLVQATGLLSLWRREQGRFPKRGGVSSGCVWP